MSKDTIEVLNDLIETSKDGERGFRSAADNVRDTQLKTFFLDLAQNCAAGARELQDVVQNLGGKPENSGTVSGALHRGWTDVRAAVSGHSDHAVLAECEKGEDVAKKHYRDALEAALPADVRAVVERQFRQVQQNHDRVRDLRDQYAAMKS